MKLILGLFFVTTSLFAQAATPLASNVTYLPKMIITAGGGYASPNGKFGYASQSTYLGAGTYATVAIEDTISKGGTVQSCTLAGVTKPQYQLSFMTFGMTGLGGGCTSTNGSATASGSGQIFLDFRFGKSAWGLIVTAMKSTTNGFKVTLAPRWAQ
jgi:hypothetical protein